MKDVKRLAIVVVISAVGMMVVVLATRIGASFASPPPPPSESQSPVVDAGIEPGIQSKQMYTLTRIQTITLEPVVRPDIDRPDLSDLMTGTYPVRVQDVYYNWPACTPNPCYVRIVTGATEFQVSTPNNPSLAYSAVDANGYIFYPGPQPWVSVSYRRRDITTTAPYAAQQAGMITVATKFGSSGIYYDPFTSTVVYARYFPPGAPSDYWGISQSLALLSSVDPEPAEQTAGTVRWVGSTNPGSPYFNGKVVLSDTIFGSDLTVTHFSVYPLTPTLGGKVHSTVTLQNVGPITAWRWFRTELYLKPEKDPPPKDALDRIWGREFYRDDAIFRKPGTLFDWKVEQLGPSQSITLITVITVTRASGSGKFKAYAQVDTAEEVAEYQAWFGSNPEGYCFRAQGCRVNTRPPQEYNVVTLRDASGQHDQIVYIPEFYWLDVSSSSDYSKARAGKKAVFWLTVANMGNVTDTYTVTVASAQPAWAVPPAFTVGPVPYEMPPLDSRGNNRTFSVTVGVPPTAHEDEFTWVTVTLKSRGDPTHIASDTIKLRAICGLYKYYLPIIKKYK